MRELGANIRRALSALCLAMLCIGGTLFFASQASASGYTPQWEGVEQQARAVEGDIFCPDRPDGIAGRVVYCMQEIVIAATKKFLEGFVTFVRPIVIAVIVLAIAIYGAMLAAGMVYPSRDTVMLAIKVGGVVLFTGVVSDAPVFGGMVDSVFGIMEGLMQIVSSYISIGSSTSFCSDQSVMPNVFASRGEAMTAWDNVDCMFISMLGLGPAAVTAVAGAAGAAHPMAAGIVVLLAGFFFLGGVGMIFVLLGVLLLLTMLISVVRAVKLYIVAMCAVAFLIAVSPIIIPLVIFKATRPIFERWISQIVGFMLVPIFLMAYLTMMVAAVDAIIFKGPSSLYWAIGREATQTEGFNMRTWLETGADGTGIAEKQVPNTSTFGLMQQIRTCADPELAKYAGEICDEPAKLAEMRDCSVDPVLPLADGGTSDSGGAAAVSVEDGDSCEEVQTKLLNEANGAEYYGFMMNSEAFAFAVAPTMETDQDRREKEEGCDNFFTCAGSFVGTAVGAVVDGASWVVGQVSGFIGGLLQFVGGAIKFIATTLSYPCRFVPGAVTDVCNFATGGTSLNVLGDVVHASGSIANFGSRVLLDGIMSALGLDNFQGFFDIRVIDYQKITAYQCKMDTLRTGGGALTATDDVAYLDNCPSVGDALVQLVYVLLTGVVVMFLMFKWLPYVSTIAMSIANGAILKSTLFGEQAASGLFQKGISNMFSKKGGGS